MEQSFLLIFSGFFGLLVGSFLNALIYRLPREINIALPRSCCPSCKKLIPWYENIPVLSYVYLKGKCSGCKTNISIEYPFIEIFSALVAVAISPKDFEPRSILSFVFYFSIFCAFLVHFIVDVKHQILPDGINIYLACLFLTNSALTKNIFFWGIGGLIGFGFPYLISYLFYKIKGQVGLGGGDIKLWGALGILLGPMGIVQNIFLSCFFGAIFGGGLLMIKVIKRETPIPFGPFIILVATFQIFFEASFEHLMRYIS